MTSSELNDFNKNEQMEIQIANIGRIVESVIMAVVVVFTISVAIVSVKPISASKATVVTTSFTADSSWVKGGWR